MAFVIVDSHTGRVVGQAKTRAAASRSVDRRDNAYGGYRYRAETAERYAERQEALAADREAAAWANRRNHTSCRAEGPIC
jgi:hypothetical protein